LLPEDGASVKGKIEKVEKVKSRSIKSALNSASICIKEISIVIRVFVGEISKAEELQVFVVQVRLNKGQEEV
jgi:hypothetical protein